MRRLVLAATLVIAIVPAVALAHSSGTTMLAATLTGGTEVPKGSPTGSGSATITINGSQVCWKFSISGIATPKASHIHKGNAGAAGPVVVPLGSAFKPSGCTTAPASVIKAITAQPSAYYVNVHNDKYPGGALRGQLGVALAGSVGPGFTISLKMNGQSVKTLKPGTYSFVINDQATIHSFALDGPHGFAKDLTTVPFTGTKTVALKLQAGTYKFYCPPHEATMFGRFTVK